MSDDSTPAPSSDPPSSSTPPAPQVPQNTDTLAGSTVPDILPTPTPFLTSADGITLVPAEIKDLYEGNDLYVRGHKCICQRFDYPHVYWRSESMEMDAEKHRSYSTSGHIFAVDPSQRDKKPKRNNNSLFGGGDEDGEYLPPPPPPSNDAERSDQHTDSAAAGADRAAAEETAATETAKIE